LSRRLHSLAWHPADPSSRSCSIRILVRLTVQRRRWRLNLPPSLDLFCLPRWSLFLLPPPCPPNLAGLEGSRKRVRVVPSRANLSSSSPPPPPPFLTPPPPPPSPPLPTAPPPPLPPAPP